MSCNNPLIIKRPKSRYPVYTMPSRMRYSTVPDGYVQVPCGWCQGCRIDRMSMWQDRFRFELLDNYKKGYSGSFITLTYNDLDVPLSGSLKKAELAQFWKRVRYFLKGKDSKYVKARAPFVLASNPNFRYISVGEYGDKIGRCHYHALVAGISPESMQELTALAWKFGFSDCKAVDSGGIRYVLKYIQKQVHGKQLEQLFTEKGLEPPFFTASNGIGSAFLYENAENIRDNNGYRFQGKWRKPSQYYRRLLCMDAEIDVSALRELEREAALYNMPFAKYTAYKNYVTEMSLVRQLRSRGIPVDESSVYEAKHAFNNFCPDVHTLQMAEDSLI